MRLMTSEVLAKARLASMSLRRQGRPQLQGRITLGRLVAPYLELRKSYRLLELARHRD
jgi:hypothetical protein